MKTLREIISMGKKCLPLTDVHGAITAKYRFFRTLLAHNQTALARIAEMEQTYFGGKPFSLGSARILYEELLEAVVGVIHSLEALSGRTYQTLSDLVERLDRELFESFNPRCALTTGEMVIPLEEVTPAMKRMVGAKAANLAAIGNELGLRVPPGFAVTSYAFEKFLEENNLARRIEEVLSKVLPESVRDLEEASRELRSIILNAAMPRSLEAAITAAYRALEEKAGRDVRIAMRSSAVGEDGGVTFAGQYETILNVTGEKIVDAYRRVLASKYSDRALAYRLQYGLEDRETPMGVVGIAMVDSRASGVLYSADPSDPSPGRSRAVKISSVWGLGEHLVDGSASSDVFVVDKKEKAIIGRYVARKETRLVTRERGGTGLDPVPAGMEGEASLDDETVRGLASCGILLEEFFNAPQDVEWAVDRKGAISVLQSRPLHLPEIPPEGMRGYGHIENPIIVSHGKTASPGAAIGQVFVSKSGDDLDDLPRDAILVAATASPSYAKVMSRVRGIITDIGSVTSHLSSVAREFGIPAIVDARHATALLKNGQVITLSADTATVYEGIVEVIAREAKPPKRLIYDSPVHRRMKDILERVAALNLVDAGSASFSAEGCRTFHDIVRYTHEQAVKEMFGISGKAGRAGTAVRMISPLPLNLLLIDLGGGLREGMTTCDEVTPECLESTPMKAFWSGFSHPGVTWEGTMGIDAGSLWGRLALGATSEFGEAPGGESYAVVSGDYLNFSARFAYHFVTVDTLCGDNIGQNYISLQFSGGAGNYYGRSLRVQFMGNVLERLGFSVTIRGDLIEAFLGRYDRKSCEERIDLLARLLASSRLLDMTMSDRDDIGRFTEAFFHGSYDFLPLKREDSPRGFSTHGGSWKRLEREGTVSCLQDGSQWGRGIASGIAGVVGKVVGGAYQEFLDTIEAYYYFPIAVLKNSELSEGRLEVRVKPVGGNIDRAGGIAFGIRGVNDYFVLRSNALESNIVLFEFVNGKRLQRMSVRKKIGTGTWHLLGAEIKGSVVRGFYEGDVIMEYDAGKSLNGSVGLWTKADSVTEFDSFSIEDTRGKRMIGF